MKKLIMLLVLLCIITGFSASLPAKEISSYDKYDWQDETISWPKLKGYRYGNITIIGNMAINTDTLQKAISVRHGDKYYGYSHEYTVESIKRLYYYSGYLKNEVLVTFNENKSSATVDITFNINENEKFYIRKIVLKEDTFFNKNIVPGLILFSEENTVDLYNMLVTKDRIKRASRFYTDNAYVNIDLEEIKEEPGKVDAVISISYEPILHFNMFNSIRNSGRTNFINSFSGSWYSPMVNCYAELGTFLGSESNSLGIPDAFRYGIESDNYFENEYVGLALKIGKNYGSSNKVFFSLLSEALNLEDSNYAVLSFIKDTRDDFFFSKSGSFYRLSFKKPVGFNYDFLKTTLYSSLYFKLFSNSVLNVRTELGVLNNSYVNNADKFYIQGFESFRADLNYNNTPLENGGKIMFIMNSDFCFPIIKDNDVLVGKIFLDIAGLWLKPEDIQFTFGGLPDRMKTAIGIGIIQNSFFHIYTGINLNSSLNNNIFLNFFVTIALRDSENYYNLAQ